MKKFFNSLFKMISSITISAIAYYIVKNFQKIINNIIWWFKRTFRSKQQKLYDEYCKAISEAEETLTKCQKKMAVLEYMQSALDEREKELDEREKKIIETEKRLGISEEVVEI